MDTTNIHTPPVPVPQSARTYLPLTSPILLAVIVGLIVVCALSFGAGVWAAANTPTGGEVAEPQTPRVCVTALNLAAEGMRRIADEPVYLTDIWLKENLALLEASATECRALAN